MLPGCKRSERTPESLNLGARCAGVAKHYPEPARLNQWNQLSIRGPVSDTIPSPPFGIVLACVRQHFKPESTKELYGFPQKMRKSCLFMRSA
jgi:hypothetical protein